ncbi:hypothetical protein [Cerasicoccus frondis]|uniref:hypothetical protein n=1 Tax=Cerasicoccus frondis TaxID=490090 RepID=UPI0028525B29|nr:hypothetical protein [Cerasicoccus frondis]
MAKKSVKQYSFSDTRTYEYIREVELIFISKLMGQKNRILSLPHNGEWHNAFNSLSAFSATGGNRDLDVSISFELGDPLEGHRLHLGTSLRRGGSNSSNPATATYSLTIIEGGCRAKSRMHFDHDFDSNGREQKPSPHIQCGGRLPSELSFQKDWDESLDKPRVLSLPYSTAILWHNAFLEFPDVEEFKSFLDDSWWKNIVIDAEERMWACFVEQARQSICRKESIIEILYGI